MTQSHVSRQGRSPARRRLRHLPARAPRRPSRAERVRPQPKDARTERPNVPAPRQTAKVRRIALCGPVSSRAACRPLDTSRSCPGATPTFDAARSTTHSAPTSTQVADDTRAAAFTATSGPIPHGQPIEIATRGFNVPCSAMAPARLPRAREAYRRRRATHRAANRRRASRKASTSGCRPYAAPLRAGVPSPWLTDESRGDEAPPDPQRATNPLERRANRGCARRSPGRAR